MTTDAFRALDPAALGGWRWRTTAVLLVSHAWDPAGDTARTAERAATAS